MNVMEFIEDYDDELGKVLGVVKQGKKFIIVREFGIEKFHPALDPMRCRLELLCKSPRRIFNVRQVRYLLELQGRCRHDFDN